jgi:plasmid stabilization system protein ParE
MAEPYRVILLPQAFDDLDAILERINEHSPQNAAAVVDRLENAVRSLEQFPHRYRIHQSNRDRARIVHAMSVPPYIVYYRVVEALHVVRILTIRHGARRQPKRFS